MQEVIYIPPTVTVTPYTSQAEWERCGFAERLWPSGELLPPCQNRPAVQLAWDIYYPALAWGYRYERQLCLQCVGPFAKLYWGAIPMLPALSSGGETF